MVVFQECLYPGGYHGSNGSTCNDMTNCLDGANEPVHYLDGDDEVTLHNEPPSTYRQLN